MRQLKVLVASPDETLSSRTASLLANRGYQVVKRCATSIETLEACFEETADLVVLDDELRTVPGSRIAGVLKDLRSPVAAVVVQRGIGTPADESLLLLDPNREGYEAALLNIADSLTPPRPRPVG
jgi:DNA-binding NarL/FixJ family response regulator